MRAMNHVDSLELGYNVAVLEVEMSIPVCTKHQWTVFPLASIARLIDGMHTGSLPATMTTSVNMNALPLCEMKVY